MTHGTLDVMSLALSAHTSPTTVLSDCVLRAVTPQ